MKKQAVVLMTAGFLFVSFLTGCGNDEKVIEGNGSSVIEGSQESGEEEQESQPLEVSSGKGYIFEYKGTKVEIDGEAAPVVEALGEAASYFEAPSCAFEGIDKTYTYSGFELDTYPQGEVDHISAVVFKDDSVATAEGICIGDTREKLEEAYGAGTEEGGMLVYAKDGMKLCFILQGDEVVSIEYRSTVLEE